MDLLTDPRYKDTPVFIFFENYVLDVIGKLPSDKQVLLEGLNLQKIFSTQADNWKDSVREALRLSSTIELAILHRWYLTVEANEQNNRETDPVQFSKEFVDAYFAENSPIDTWDEASLMDAKEFVQKHQMREKTPA